MNIPWPAVAWLAAGALTIGLGGVFTTKGWDYINSQALRTALINAAIQELEQNRLHLSDMENAGKNIESPTSLRMFSRFHYSNVQQIQTSRFFTTISPGIPLAISNYVKIVGPANDQIQVLNERTLRQIPSEQKRENIRKIVFSPIMSDYREVHDTLYELLKTQK